MSWPDKALECEHCGKKFYCVNCLFDLTLHQAVEHGKGVNKIDPNMKEYSDEPEWFYRNDKRIARIEKNGLLQTAI